jgi:hypothetical protein
VIWRVLHQEVEYKEMGPGQVSPQTLNRKFRRLMKEFVRHGVAPLSVLDEITIAAQTQSQAKASFPESANA